MGAAAGLVLAAGAAPAAAGVQPPAPPGGAEWWFTAWRIPETWQQSRGAGITVAVVESGVQASVPELAGVVLPGTDLSGTGDGRQDFGGEGHGTAMAAYVAANGLGTGMLGVAPEARVLPVTIAHGPSGFSAERMAAGVRFAVDHHADVVNLSIGVTDPSDPSDPSDPRHCPAVLQRAVRYAVDRGAVVVAAAGNEGDAANLPGYPAACRGVVTVGAVDRQARPWASSQRQPYVDVAAPGVGMRAINQFGHATEGEGTSDAAALTSGAVALVWARHRNLSNRQVVARLLATLRDRPPGGGRDPQRGYGTLWPLAAVTAEVPPDAPNPIFDELRDAPAADPGGVPAATPWPHPGDALRRHHHHHSGPLTLRSFVIDIVVPAMVLLLSALLARRRRRRGTASGQPHPFAPEQPWQSTHGPGPYAGPPAYGPYAGPPPQQSGPLTGPPPFPGMPAPPGPPPYGYGAGAPGPGTNRPHPNRPSDPYGGPSGPAQPHGEPPEPAPPPAG